MSPLICVCATGIRTYSVYRSVHMCLPGTAIICCRMCAVNCTSQFVRIYNNDNALQLEATCPASHQINNAPAYQISAKVIDDASNFSGPFSRGFSWRSSEWRGRTVQNLRRTQNTVTDA